MKVKEHLAVAELLGGVITPGHYYDHFNDAAHYNHVHVAFLPWGEPDEPHAVPSVTPRVTDAALAYRSAFETKFDNQYAWGGTFVYKHRNGDPDQPWSQHAFGNAVDYMALGSAQQPIIDWLESEWKDGTEDDMLDENWTKGYAEAWDEFVAGTKNPSDYLTRNVGNTGDSDAEKAKRARYIGRRAAAHDFVSLPKP